MKIGLFVLFAVLASCNRNSKSETIHETNRKDFTFQGLSIFRNGSSILEIKKQLDSMKVKYFIVSSDNEYLDVFALPFECCQSQTIMYLPSYNFGELYISDLFLIFGNETLAAIRAEEVTDGRNSSILAITELRKFFIEKYGNGDTSIFEEPPFYRTREVLTNISDSITITFEQMSEKDSVMVLDYKVPINETANAINNDKASFRNSIVKSKNKIPKANPIAGGLGTNNGWYSIFTHYVSFEMIFPNRMSECCDENVDAEGKKNKRIKREEKILKSI